MGPSKYVGRVGGLAAALGIGVAMFTAPAVAWAETDSPSASSESDSASNGAPSRGDSPRARKSDTSTNSPGRVRNGRAAADSAADVPAADVPSIDVPAADAGPAVPAPQVDAPRRNRAANNSALLPAAASPAKPVNASPVSAPAVPAAAAADLEAPAAVTTSVIAVAPAASLPTQFTLPPALISKLNTLLPVKPVILPVKPTPTPGTTLATVADRLTTAVNNAVARIVDALANGSPFIPATESPANWLLAAFARKQPLNAAATNLVQANAETLPVMLNLNGYNVVPAGIETVVNFYGQWTYWPGVSSTTQGVQDYSLVDPVTQQSVGNFSALVQQGDPTSLGTRYVELLVTANDGQNVGIEAGQIPPVGSIISSWTLLGMFGWKYSSMPTSPDTNKVVFKAVTPFGDITVPFFNYDAAEGIVNHTFDNKPIDVTEGFSIVPENPDGETITALSGLLPLFNSLQGNQRFKVVDSDGVSQGSFQGDFTVTGDVIGIYTEAIRVTANDGINVGTGPGEVPPVGSVYNVAYLDLLRSVLLYSSKPIDGGGTAIEAVLMTPFGNIKFPSRLNASVEPPLDIVAPGGKSFIATSEQLPAGVNGLPPRDVQVQGYQQFDVLDSDGDVIGKVDADVVSQWDSYGLHSKSLLITKVREGTPGADPSDVPTVGTVVNVIYATQGRFGVSNSITPLPTGEVRAFQFLTPFGVIPLTPVTAPVGRVPVEYYNPFDIV